MIFNRCFKFTVLAVWLGCMSWLVRYEAFPHWFEDTIQGYRTLTRELPAVKDSWMKVLWNGEHVGYSNSTVEVDEADGKEDWLMRSQLMLHLQMPDGDNQLRIDTRVNIRDGRRLHGFLFTFFLGNMQGEIQGERDTGDYFNVELQVKPMLGDARMKWRIQIPEQAIIAGPMMDTGLRNLRPDQEMRMRTFNPMSVAGELSEVLFRGEGHEMLTIGDGEPVHVSRVSMRTGEVVFYAWLNEHGQVLRQETPFGFVLEAATVNDAVRVPEGNKIPFSQLLSNPLIPNLPNL
ncbi:MAG: hypothetical protein JJU29_20230 [Verrucomicrobia bacterium]|nr:hypothetical protein [Verrucomicrobiota bacterium]MCH8511675.1 hypothetical protein [Kiritimatiellia bacterium]